METIDPDTGHDLATRWDAWSDDGLPPYISQRLLATGVYGPSTVATVAGLADELEVRLAQCAAFKAVDGLLAAGSTWEDRCDRRAVVRILERLAQLKVPSLPWPGWLPPDPNARRRILTDVERSLVRHCSLATTGRSAVVGALDSGAASGELALLLRSAVALDEAGSAVALDLAGTQRDVKSGYPEAAPRRRELALWSRPAFTSLLTGRTGDRPLLYGGHATDLGKIQSSLLMTVGAVLADAGLAGDPTVKPLSIRNSFGRAFYDLGRGIEATAAVLGHHDLMSVTREIGISPHKAARRR